MDVSCNPPLVIALHSSLLNTCSSVYLLGKDSQYITRLFIGIYPKSANYTTMCDILGQKLYCTNCVLIVFLFGIQYVYVQYSL